MNIFSFSLYGTNQKYVEGAVENAALIQNLGPGWKSVFYLGAEVSTSTEDRLFARGAEIRRWSKDWHKNGMFWRFSAAQEFDFNFVSFRDTDSRISQRELDAMASWFRSGKILHIMRDHPNHNAAIMGGMWGLSSKVKSVEINWGSQANYSEEHGQDQLFLKQELYPKLKRSSHVNDSFFSFPRYVYKFPTSRRGLNYVGEAFESNGASDEGLRQQLQTYLDSRGKRTIILLKFLIHKLL